MTEGWNNDDYLVLFDGPEEIERMTDGYGLRQDLPDYLVVGLKGWDNFIVRDGQQRNFTVPTTPVRVQDLASFAYPLNAAALRPDPRFQGKVKWYVKPILFGGSPTAKENLTWLSYPQHVEAVRWWNKLFREISAKGSNL